jgi:hypothetical protein
LPAFATSAGVTGDAAALDPPPEEEPPPDEPLFDDPPGAHAVAPTATANIAAHRGVGRRSAERGVEAMTTP